MQYFLPRFLAMGVVVMHVIIVLHVFDCLLKAIHYFFSSPVSFLSLSDNTVQCYDR